MTAELTLRDYLEILRRRAWLVALSFLGALALALIWSAAKTPQYQSSARVLINQAASTDIFDPTAGSSTNTTFADRQATTAVELIESQLVDTEAEARLGFEAEIDARVESRADVVVLTATNEDASVATSIAQTYAESYLDIQRSEFTEERLATAEELSIKIAELDVEIAALRDAADTTRKQTLRDDLADSYDRLLISANLGNSGTARIIDNAEVPESPVTPRTNRNMALGGVLGLMLGAGAALLLESLDTSIKSRQVIEGLTPGLPALASIPAMKTVHQVISLERPEGLETEVFRTLRASIEFAAVDQPIAILQVTSAGASAGKTTVAANLAAVMAQAGQRVAVVDCDLRRPRLHEAFGIAQVPGISSVIIGRSDAEDASHDLMINNGRLRVVPSGPIPPGPSELLGSERTQKTFARLRRSLDVVIIDSPPVLPVSDALVLSRMVDATIVVANAKSTKRDELVRALEQLDQAGARVIGTVLNQVKANADHGYGYGYGYGYGEGSRGALFNRSTNFAPRPEGTAVLDSAELPRFEAARTAPRIAAKNVFTQALASPSWLDDGSDNEPRDNPGEEPAAKPSSTAGEASRAAARRSDASRRRDNDGANSNGADNNSAAKKSADNKSADNKSAGKKSAGKTSVTNGVDKKHSPDSSGQGPSPKSGDLGQKKRKRPDFSDEELEGWDDEIVVS